jgi:hypothetical protein
MCKLIRDFLIVGSLTIALMVLLEIVNITNTSNIIVKELDKNDICYSFFIENLKRKDVFGEDLQIERFCLDPNILEKIKFYDELYGKCIKGEYSGVPNYNLLHYEFLKCRSLFLNEFVLILWNSYGQTSWDTLNVDYCTNSTIQQNINEMFQYYKKKYDICL